MVYWEDGGLKGIEEYIWRIEWTWLAIAVRSMAIDGMSSRVSANNAREWARACSVIGPRFCTISFMHGTKLWQHFLVHSVQCRLLYRIKDSS
jgi:hypothetical protein